MFASHIKSTMPHLSYEKGAILWSQTGDNRP
jgi:hypothetical protein